MSRSALKPYWPWLKALVALGAVAFIVLRQPWSELWAAIKLLSLGAVALSIVAQIFGVMLGTLRWRFVLIAFGATALPSFLTLLRMYFVGQFYNTYLPFSVGGDVVRGVAARDAFGERGASASVATVFIERLLGLSAVLALTLVAVNVQGETGPAHALLVPAAILLCAVIAGSLCLPLARHAARFVPAFVRPHLERLPSVQSYPAFIVALLVSLGTQLMVVTFIHVLAVSAHPSLRFSDSMFVAPVASAAAYLPISIAGIGPRDIVLVSLFELVGVPRAEGTAIALATLVVSLLVALIGGVIELFSVRARRAERAA